jgi:outer membrane protein, multidrug efflux system
LPLRDFPNKENHLKTRVEKSVSKDFSYASYFGTFAGRLCQVIFVRSLSLYQLQTIYEKKAMKIITNSSLGIFLTAIFFVFGFSVSVPAQNSVLGEADLEKLRQEVPTLSQDVRFTTEQGRQMLEFSLKDVLHLMLYRNTTIQSSKFGEAAASAQLIVASQFDKPVLTATIQQTNSASVLGTDLADTTASPYLTSLNRSSTALISTLSKKNTLGMKFSASVQRTVTQSKSYSMAEEGGSLEGGTPTDDPLAATVLSAGVSIPLFQDWGEVNNLPIRRGEIGVDRSRLATQQSTVGLLESAAKTYWNLVGVRENIKTLKEAVKLSQTLVNETSARVEIGVLNLTDLKESQTQLASNQQKLLSAIIQEQEIDDQIRSTLNLGSQAIGFKPIDLPAIHREDLNYRQKLNKIFQFHPDLKSLEYSLKSNAFDMEEALNADKTNLDLDISYSLSGYGRSTTEALQASSQAPLQGYQLGLSITVPLFNKAIDQTILKRQAEKSQFELRIRDKKQQLSINLQTILRNIRFGLEEEKTAMLSVNLAQDLLEKEIEKLKLGKSTSFTVSQAQQKHTDAKLNEILVRVRNEQNYISLIALTGEIYSSYDLPETQ